jgi:hypothetical protein
MLPRLDAFLAGIKLFARRRHPTVVAFDEPALADAIAHAALLAAGREQDEPAALFFACALRSRAFGAASHDLLPLIARNQAGAWASGSRWMTSSSRSCTLASFSA